MRVPSGDHDACCQPASPAVSRRTGAAPSSPPRTVDRRPATGRSPRRGPSRRGERRRPRWSSRRRRPRRRTVLERPAEVSTWTASSRRPGHTWLVRRPVEDPALVVEPADQRGDATWAAVPVGGRSGSTSSTRVHHANRRCRRATTPGPADVPPAYDATARGSPGRVGRQHEDRGAGLGALAVAAGERQRYRPSGDATGLAVAVVARRDRPAGGDGRWPAPARSPTGPCWPRRRPSPTTTATRRPVGRDRRVRHRHHQPQVILWSHAT